MNLKILIYGFLIMISAVSCNKQIIDSESLITKSAELKSATISTNKYVAKTGSDSNAGTSSSPFLTISKGLSVAGAGDTVFVKSGTYQEYVTFENSGTTGSPIVLKNFGSDIATVDAANTNVYCIYATGKHDLVVDGITVKNSLNYNIAINACENVTLKNVTSVLPVVTGSTIYNIFITSSTNWNKNITLDNIKTTGGFFGIEIVDKANGVNVIGGEFSYASNSGVDASCLSDTAVAPHNITINGAYSHNNGWHGVGTRIATNVTVRNCHSSYNGATGIQIEAFTYNTIVEDNVCEYNSKVFTYETGIWIFNSDKSIVRRNTIRGNQSGLRIWGTTNFEAYLNLILDNNYKSEPACTATSGVDFKESSGTFYNNVLIGNAEASSLIGSVHVFPDGVCNLQIKNNIIMNDGSAKDMDFDQVTGSTVVSDNNLIYNVNRPINIQVGTTNYVWSAYKTACGQDAHSVNANPLFVSSADYSLQATSPAINAGVKVGLTCDYSGRAINGLPDIGAYENIVSTPPATIYYNTQSSATATKSDCGTGYTGSVVTYTVSASKYSSTVSQADADNKALADLNTNKQTYANANGTCTVIPVTVYYNTQVSATATKSDCGTGYTGSVVTYTVSASKYSSTVSQADANNKATTDLNTNKQTYANANGTCTAIPVTVYYNTQVSATATKSNCGTGYTGSVVTYTVSANKYSSTVSQADADNKALTDLNTNKQTYANSNGTCTVIPVTVYYNLKMSATATKNNCGTGYKGSTLTYTVSAGKYSSTISQTDANNKATSDLIANKQTYANTYGTCTRTYWWRR